MSQLDSLFSKETPQEPNFKLVGGSFQCQHCDEEVQLARYYWEQQLLVWTCESGHKSKIEKFSL